MLISFRKRKIVEGLWSMSSAEFEVSRMSRTDSIVLSGIPIRLEALSEESALISSMSGRPRGLLADAGTNVTVTAGRGAAF